MKNIQLFYVLLLIWNVSNAQKEFAIKGMIPEAKNKEVLLKGYTMMGDSLLNKVFADDNGNFAIAYPASFVGAAVLAIKEFKSIIVLLNHENFEMKWPDLEAIESIKFNNSLENNAFTDGVALAQQSQNILAGLLYLKPIYEKEIPFSIQKIGWIDAEIDFRQKALPTFLATLPQNAYAIYYLKLRKLLQDMPITANHSIEQMPNHERFFNEMDFADKNLVQSGLYRELLDGYFLLMESHGNIENVCAHVNFSTDAILKSLENHPVLKQEVAEYLFRLFEKRSLFQAAEHLALAMLNSQNCEMDSKHEALFEQYRKMAKGKIAPNIVFENASKPFSKLSDIKTKYRLVVFGASWCSKCQEEIPKLKPFYSDWKTKYDLEIVFASLDTEPKKYTDFTADFPWISICDYKGWESKAAVDYCVFGTPTMYLLDANQTIVLKPISEKQVQAWLEMVEKK